MESSDAIAAVQIVVMIAVMLHASASDARTRRVPDADWIVMCAVCIPLHAVASGDALGAMGSAVLATYMLSQRLIGLPGAAAAILGTALYAADWLSSGDTDALSAPAMFWLFWMLYQARVLPGGADAKCLMSVSLVMPSLPGIGHLIFTGSVLPPALSIAAIALILSLSAAAYNLRRSGGGSARGYTVPIDEADPARELPLQRAVGGRVVRARVDPADSERVLEELKDAGAEEVEVSPLIPFLVPLTAAFVLVAVLGDPFSLAA